MKPITIANLPEASAQEVFDWIVSNLLRQNHRSVGVVEAERADILTCVYRSPEGYKCAAGWVMADDEYRPEMENTAWVCLAEQGVVPSDHASLIGHAQTIHDTEIPEDWPVNFTRLAVEYNLNTWLLDKPEPLTV
jgi:hypothetical protein